MKYSRPGLVPVSDAIENLTNKLIALGCDPAEAVSLIVAACSRPAALSAPSYAKLPTFVYALVYPWNVLVGTSPRRKKSPFYIGVSVNPWNRFYNHRNDACSPAFGHMKYFHENGAKQDQILIIIDKLASRNKALDLEHKLITTIPHLLNVSRNHTQMWGDLT